jgi:hypothetical protein
MYPYETNKQMQIDYTTDDQLLCRTITGCSCASNYRIVSRAARRPQAGHHRQIDDHSLQDAEFE